MDQTLGAAEQQCYYWSGSDWLNSLSPDGFWRWDGHAWIESNEMVLRRQTPRRRGRARILQALLASWIVAVVLELFIFDFWFSLDFTAPDGAVTALRWGLVSTFLAGTIAVATPWWLAPIARLAFRMVRATRSLGVLLWLLISLAILYVGTDVFIAEGVRGIAINGPEIRLPVLISAAFGIAAAVAALVLVHSITDAVEAER